MSDKLPEEITACKITGYRADENGDCPACGGDACIIRFKFTKYLGDIPIYRAWFLSGPGLPERRVSRENYCQAERAAGFTPKPGLGPEATASFGTEGLSGRTVDTWPSRVFTGDDR